MPKGKHSTAEALLSFIVKTNDCKTARSVVRVIMTEDLSSRFSWKGQARRDQPHKYAFASTETYKLVHVIVKKVHKNSAVTYRVDNSLMDFFAHIKPNEGNSPPELPGANGVKSSGEGCSKEADVNDGTPNSETKESSLGDDVDQSDKQDSDVL